jgi:hypothetical protein
MASYRTGRVIFIPVDQDGEGMREGYQSRTLTTTNSGRLVYLPVYPTKAGVTEESVLLANVPGKSCALK